MELINVGFLASILVLLTIYL